MTQMSSDVAGTARAEAAPAKRRNSPGRAAIRLLVIVSVLFLGLRWSGVLESTGFIHPRLTTFPTPPDAQDVFFQTSDGLKLHGWFLPALGRKAGDPPGPVVLHCHGNAGSIDEHISWSDFLTNRGISVFLFDYRSFGRSADGGRWLTRNDLMRDSRAALAYLKTRPDVDPKRIGVYGCSLGGAFALGLAAENPSIACAATVCTFSSWPAVASDFVPVLSYVLI